MTLGLGTGSTVRFALVRLAERIRGEGLSIRGVPTSSTPSARRASSASRSSVSGRSGDCDLTIDGADEIDPPSR
jgi:ribose 5-phosphate isomerase A